MTSCTYNPNFEYYNFAHWPQFEVQYQAFQLTICKGQFESFTQSGSSRDDECGICREVLDDGEHILVHVDCKNGFHADCLTAWITIDKSEQDDADTNCPFCRIRFELSTVRAWRQLMTLCERTHRYVEDEELVIRGEGEEARIAVSDMLSSSVPSILMNGSGTTESGLPMLQAALEAFDEVCRSVFSTAVIDSRILMWQYLAQMMFDDGESDVAIGRSAQGVFSDMRRKLRKYSRGMRKTLNPDLFTGSFRVELNELWQSASVEAQTWSIPYTLALCRAFVSRLKLMRPYFEMQMAAELHKKFAEYAIFCSSEEDDADYLIEWVGDWDMSDGQASDDADETEEQYKGFTYSSNLIA